jgi:hypothetical protein
VIRSFADGRVEDTGPLTRKRLETVDDESLAAAGEPDIKEKLKKSGVQAIGRTYKVRLDGYNVLSLLAGQTDKSPRREILYFFDAGDLTALPYQDRKLVFMERPSRGRGRTKRCATNTLRIGQSLVGMHSTRGVIVSSWLAINWPQRVFTSSSPSLTCGRNGQGNDVSSPPPCFLVICSCGMLSIRPAMSRCAKRVAWCGFSAAAGID